MNWLIPRITSVGLSLRKFDWLTWARNASFALNRPVVFADITSSADTPDTTLGLIASFAAPTASDGCTSITPTATLPSR